MKRAKTTFLASLSIFLSATTVNAAPITIDFNDGTAGSSVGEFYAGLGVTFSNATWTSTLGDPLAIYSSSDTFRPKADNPIIATFSSAVSFVSIFGRDVGGNGIRIDAYDSPVAGNLVDFDEFFGTGIGVGTEATIAASDPSIWRVEFYQPDSIVAGEGMVWDNFTFDSDAVASVPEPGTLALLGIGLAGMGVARRRWNA
ncbi:PEP-CTERM sorting domain-containing protein [Marinobacter pelagius]|uniref:PEP-CTERM protein-sorting domain-containing protein n=1 Tax=Marinobacter pelagius TaxID=379482 RepID=A0A1I4ZLU2_9GAMM|nr:PEP-CTERM sorting domain-containing protein [Marinobacter pelagius]SFN51212.1 PEP-CTERM protein-sorting domain-containing protein [Marinobacter pelagius]